jgi:hypothetical protein
MLGAGGVLGFVWFIESAPVTSFAIPLFLLALAVTPSNLVSRHLWLVLLGAALCVVDISIRGFPMVRNHEALDIEILSITQLILIAYFVISALHGTTGGLFARMRNLIP